MTEVEKDERDRRQGDRGVNEACAEKNAEAIGEITHRLGQKRIDLALANIGGDLPFILGRRYQVAHQEREQVIINHRSVVVTVQAAAAFVKNGAPEKDGAGQWYQTEKRAQEIIPAVDERVLQPDIEDGDVLLDLHAALAGCSSCAASCRSCHRRMKMSAQVAPIKANSISSCVSQISPWVPRKAEEAFPPTSAVHHSINS